MNYKVLILTLITMALTTYLIRVIPMIAFKKKIENRFLKSILAYVPYAVIASITFPGVIYSTDYKISAIIGFVTAIVLAYYNKSLIAICGISVLTVFVVERILVYMNF